MYSNFGFIFSGVEYTRGMARVSPDGGTFPSKLKRRLWIESPESSSCFWYLPRCTSADHMYQIGDPPIRPSCSASPTFVAYLTCIFHRGTGLQVVILLRAYPSPMSRRMRDPVRRFLPFGILPENLVGHGNYHRQISHSAAQEIKDTLRHGMAWRKRRAMAVAAGRNGRPTVCPRVVRLDERLLDLAVLDEQGVTLAADIAEEGCAVEVEV